MENSTETKVNSGEQAEVVDSTSHNSDFDLVEENSNINEKVEADDEQGGVVDTPKQTREDNHFAKQARIKAEREAKANAEKMANEKLAKLLKESGVENPYTDKPFESVEEFTEYGKKVKEAKLKEKAEESGRTIEEVQEEEEAKEFLREKKKQEESDRLAEEKKSKEEEARSNFFETDLNDFMEKYPNVDVAKLDNNEAFREFCGSRYGREPLAELYASFTKLVESAERAGEAKRDTRGDRSTGTGSSGGERLTAQQQRALDDWNRNNPDMKMTPKEFLSR